MSVDGARSIEARKRAWRRASILVILVLASILCAGLNFILQPFVFVSGLGHSGSNVRRVTLAAEQYHRKHGRFPPNGKAMTDDGLLEEADFVDASRGSTARYYPGGDPQEPGVVIARFEATQRRMLGFPRSRTLRVLQIGVPFGSHCRIYASPW
jgi:hypothetical protein